MEQFKEFLIKIFYSVGANLISLIVSLLTTLVVPRFLGADVEQYGYLQIYLFYITYLGLFHFGWCDGIFLREGGKKYSDLDKSLYSAQFILFLGAETLVTVTIIIIGNFIAQNGDYLFVFIAFAINILIYLPRTMLQYFLQSTNRIKEYAEITTVGRTVYGISILVIVLFFSKNYKWFVIGDIFGKLVALIISIYFCRDIVFFKPGRFSYAISEAKLNISIGIKLTFSNIASMLITGIVRWGIQQHWSVSTYGKISLTLSVSSLIMVFISAVAIVLYPTLRRVEHNKLPLIYGYIRTILMFFLLALLIVYYPMETILIKWLPQYSDGLKYMALLFPMCIYSSKMTLLVQTYMNVYRMEKDIMKVNIIGVLFAIITTIISILFLDNLTIAVLCMVINQMFRCIYAEVCLSHRIKIKIIKDSVYEVLLSVIFIFSSWNIGGSMGLVVYGIGYSIYIWLKREDFIEMFAKLKRENF